MTIEEQDEAVHYLLEKMYEYEGKIKALHDLGLDYTDELDVLLEATDRMMCMTYDLAESRLLCAKLPK
jgi:hypothetical protein